MSDYTVSLDEYSTRLLEGIREDLAKISGQLEKVKIAAVTQKGKCLWDRVLGTEGRWHGAFRMRCCGQMVSAATTYCGECREEVVVAE